jgi:hypothetical protein
MSHQITLSDSTLTLLVQWLRPLEPLARNAFIEQLVEELRGEPEQPPGDGTVFRIARSLLRSGMYRRTGEYILAEGAHQQAAKHYQPRRATR